ncbi:hypothetical protein FA10DRAFT_266384 [Acaromyces ingoldii]|uniref:Uncharacterized protein n=1 Tax=Acaromyces ingoldii TaxID=215250 RepID=A0A316YME7_9BASI|nr:hypothetical protein FA10DRAFT_266384 [Acaromyces ingoldii]PWN89838.1 hypothetical protein FA10DRAFT_266384 [Acaromyces ingoldii]
MPASECSLQPKDSRHPDAKLKVPVLVEKFLSEAEYEEARAQKLLSFQEEERQRDIEEAARKKEEEELRKRSSASGSNRFLATPNKIKRNLDLLFSSPGPLLSPLGSRKRHVSASPLSTSPRQYKKLSLSMGLDSSASGTPSAEQERGSMAPPAAATTPQRPRARSASLSAPQAATTPSKRIPLLSSSTARRSASPSKMYQSIPASPASSPSSPSSTIEAKKRREANLLRLLQLECDRRRRSKV